MYLLSFERNDGSDMVLESSHLMNLHTVIDLEKMKTSLRDQGSSSGSRSKIKMYLKYINFFSFYTYTKKQSYVT
jgi:hypothetical protein